MHEELDKRCWHACGCEMITVVNLQQARTRREEAKGIFISDKKMNSYHFARIETFNGVLETYFLAFEQFSELFLALHLQKKNEFGVQCFEVLDGAMAPTLLTKKLGECARSIRTPHMHYICTTHMHRE